MIDEQKWELAFLKATVKLQVREMVLTEKQDGETNIQSQGGGYVPEPSGAVQSPNGGIVPPQ